MSFRPWLWSWMSLAEPRASLRELSTMIDMLQTTFFPTRAVPVKLSHNSLIVPASVVISSREKRQVVIFAPFIRQEETDCNHQ
ncbi:predicted protein [Sclerotinia sclerotiorum 1980 UF-70]|uniref:Uncharacterized protein n=1 Tax=Sclerotinia sclerotiorum (strain ATCC 18683 / 1980 / Ss-1) TaxID=665079 RepID=A7ERI5_SCLS1|nr:predicted protein [Sclerotinia sclerotiorum 1980 UF-70]EDN92077.1 predicted protein [Sclerotinia sclerotiorum 1980 UF-70]